MKVFYNPMSPYKSPRFETTREQMRNLARENVVKRGRNTMDTYNNLKKAGLINENKN